MYTCMGACSSMPCTCHLQRGRAEEAAAVLVGAVGRRVEEVVHAVEDDDPSVAERVMLAALARREFLPLGALLLARTASLLVR